jgi:hypothetical protein
MKHCEKTTSSPNGSANTGDVADSLTTALDLQRPPVIDMREQGAQSVLTLKRYTTVVPIVTFLDE